MTKYQIYYDAFQEAKWFQNLNPEFLNAELVSINKASDKEVMRLFRYDKPDIILAKDKKAVLALERTTEVPTGHNVGQRFARIVCSAEEKVPFIYFFPFLAMKHGEHASACWVNARLIKAIERLSEIHKVPILAVNWECDEEYELIKDGSQDSFLKEIVASFVKSNFERPTILGQVYKMMEEKYHEALQRHPQYSNLPPTAKEVLTEDYLTEISSKLEEVKIKQYIKSRKRSLVYQIGMKYVRSDPYTGTQLIYDYLRAREGPSPRERSMNIILNMPHISVSLWKRAAKSKARKDVRLFTRFADLIVLSNGVIMP